MYHLLHDNKNNKMIKISLNKKINFHKINYMNFYEYIFIRLEQIIIIILNFLFLNYLKLILIYLIIQKNQFHYYF